MKNFLILFAAITICIYAKAQKLPVIALPIQQVKIITMPDDIYVDAKHSGEFEIFICEIPMTGSYKFTVDGTIIPNDQPNSSWEIEHRLFLKSKAGQNFQAPSACECDNTKNGSACTLSAQNPKNVVEGFFQQGDIVHLYIGIENFVVNGGGGKDGTLKGNYQVHITCSLCPPAVGIPRPGGYDTTYTVAEAERTITDAFSGLTATLNTAANTSHGIVVRWSSKGPSFINIKNPDYCQITEPQGTSDWHFYKKKNGTYFQTRAIWIDATPGGPNINHWRVDIQELQNTPIADISCE